MAASPAPHPPRLFRWLLHRLLPADDRECAISDLDEEFDARRGRHGHARAARWYRAQVARSILPVVIHPRWPRRLRTELDWAWRGVRGRRSAAAFHVGIVALALAANAVVFSATDAFVFNPAPYPNADRLVVLQRDLRRPGMAPGPGDGGASEALASTAILAWRDHKDLFTSVHAYETNVPAMHLDFNGITESVAVAAVTPGLFDTLGVVPRWGRPFLDGDELPGQPSVVVIGERLAGRLFGDPARAVDRSVGSGPATARIIGVMPEGFRFPTVAQEVWRPLQLAASSGRSERLYSTLALIARGTSLADVARTVVTRNPSVIKAAHVTMSVEVPTIVPLSKARRDSRSLLLVILLGAAVCLLLVACLNVASLQFASAIGRVRTYAVQSALGATRASLVRTALLEGALLTTAGAVAGAALAMWAAGALSAWLPTAMRDRLANPIDVDVRTIVFGVAATIVTWLATSLPVAWRASRPNLVDDLRRDAHTTGISRAEGLVRHMLMAAEVALTVVLLAGALSFVRSYAAHARETKGFDSTTLVNVEVVLPSLWSNPHAAPTVVQLGKRQQDSVDLREAILTRLRAHSAVASVTRAERTLPSIRADTGSLVEIEGRPRTKEWANFANYIVDPEYFRTLGIRLLRGRMYGPGDPANLLIIDESFAKKYWPNGDAIGARLHLYASATGNFDWEIIGVASHVRGDTPDTPSATTVFVIYPRPPDVRPVYGDSLKFIARLDDVAHASQVTEAVRSVAPGTVVRVERVDDRYARLYGDTGVAAGITSGFGLMAFIVAMAGVYGVMAFLVVGRTREIGIRLALGAEAVDVRRLILGPAMVFVGAGTALGVGAALAVSHWMKGQLFGVSATDPATYAGVAGLILFTAFVAAWRPAERATQIDPAVTLRAE